MKIGVYGDSFACSLDRPSIIYAWYNLLPKYIPEATVKSFGQTGTSVFHSYNKFLETHQDFDKVIFLVSEPGRYTKKVENIAGHDRIFTNLLHLEHFIKTTDLTDDERETLDYLKGWFIMNDEDYQLKMAELMLRDMESVKPDILFFPSFPTSMTKERRKQSGIKQPENLMDFVHIQRKQLKLKPDMRGLIESDVTLSCHFTEEFNDYVAKTFANKLLSDEWDWKDIKKIKLTYDKDFYYKASKQ